MTHFRKHCEQKKNQLIARKKFIGLQNLESTQIRKKMIIMKTFSNSVKLLMIVLTKPPLYQYVILIFRHF